MLACDRGGTPHQSAPLRIQVQAEQGPSSARVIVTGIDPRDLRALRAAGWGADPRTPLLQVTVADNAVAPIAGRHTVGDSTIEFRPAFPFEAGRSYLIRVDPRELKYTRADSVLSTTIAFPATFTAPSTVVRRILPSGSTVPENLLRLYIEFSAPMSRGPGLGFIHLIDDHGREVPSAFLPLEADFWNPSHTRYTVFLDPGRVKQGIRPNEEMGRALRAGRAYALVVDTGWHDANGARLAEPFRFEFRAGPAVTTPITLFEWTIAAPRAGTSAPLVVKFPRALDHGILQRALGVATSAGTRVTGEVEIGPGEREWRFTPSEPWRAGNYSLVVLSILEDPQGNRIGRPFEVDMFERVDSTAAPERHTLPFRIR